MKMNEFAGILNYKNEEREMKKKKKKEGTYIEQLDEAL